MPLAPGSSEQVISRNVSLLVAEGKPREQAIAIALERAGKRKKKKVRKAAEGGMMYGIVYAEDLDKGIHSGGGGKPKKKKKGRKTVKTGPLLVLRKAARITGPGGVENHRHAYDDSKSGLTSRTQGHRHPVVVGTDGSIVIARTDGHVHPVA